MLHETSSSVIQLNDLGATQVQKMKLFYNDLYEVTLPPGHRFPMQKYRMVRDVLEQDADISDLVEFSPSPVASAGDLRTTHDPEYIKRFLCNQLTERENRNIGFPWSRASVKRALSSVGGTVAAMHAVCRDGYAAAGHLAGGTHHAFFDRGEGFCVFSDIAVAINVALRDYGEEAGGWLSRVLIVDLDVHQVPPCCSWLVVEGARQERSVEAGRQRTAGWGNRRGRAAAAATAAKTAVIGAETAAEAAAAAVTERAAAAAAAARLSVRLRLLLQRQRRQPHQQPQQHQQPQHQRQRQ